MRRVGVRGRAMGSDVHVITWSSSSADRLADLALRRIALLEQCWSRFRPDSELSLLNARAGHGPVPVSEDLERLVSAMVAAHAWSEGDVDATVHGAMVAMGYGADFSTIASSAVPSSWDPVPSAGMSGVVVTAGSVALATGVAMDPGAIGKGLAGDIVTSEIDAAGAAAVLVSIGGDVVTRGTPPDAEAWQVSLRDDRTPTRDEIGVISLAGAQRAVATSSTLRRRWAGRHHVVDPRTGSPVATDIVQASVVADCGWRAEAGATVALVRGSASAGWLEERGCTAYLLAEVPVHA